MKTLEETKEQYGFGMQSETLGLWPVQMAKPSTYKVSSPNKMEKIIMLNIRNMKISIIEITEKHKHLAE